MARSWFPALATLSAGALLACAPVGPTSARELAGELSAGLSLDASIPAVLSEGARPSPALEAPTPTRAPRAERPLLALASVAEDDTSALGSPEAAEVPEVSNHEPAIAPRPLAYECRLPPVAIPKAPACAGDAPYPRCRWQMPMPRAAGGLYSMWRNTTEDRWWGRPGLVGVLVAAAREFERLHPEQGLDIGDLDAAGPRHATHDRGVDVDLYLRGAMVTENEGAGAAPWNYWDRDPRHIEALRWRVEELARILATCTEGRLRIYYNDPVVEQRFHAWFREQGYRSPFGAPMQPHNDLHQFHFHVTIADDIPVPPALRAHPSAPPTAPSATVAALSPRP